MVYNGLFAERWERFDGTLAATRLDVDFHVRHRFRAVSTVVLAGVRMGSGMDILAGSTERLNNDEFRMSNSEFRIPNDE
jgi:hypothetical protein